MKQFSKKQIYWGATILTLALVSFFMFSDKKSTLPENTVTVKRGDVIQEVSLTGRVQPVTEADLSFEKSGRVLGIYANVGDHVSKGALIAEIESSGAQAGLIEAKARLSELERGSRPEEIAVKKAELAKYEQDLANEYSGISDILNDAFNKGDEAIHTKMTGIFSGFKTSSYKFTYLICDTQLTTNGEWLRYTTELDLDAWRNEIANLPIAPKESHLIEALDRAGAHIEIIRTTIEAINKTLTLDCTVSTPALDTYRTNINTARTNIGTIRSTINTKKQDIASLTLTVAKIKSELSLLESGTATEVIDAEKARVLSAESELRKYRIYAPIDGTITRADIKEGESANTTTAFFSIISDSNFAMKASVPEADIAKIHTGDIARITLDAYGSDVLFEGRVVAIDPAETIVDNVSTYNTTLAFTKNDTRIKSGMTANIDIVTAKKIDVLFLPQRAITSRNGDKVVTLITGEMTTETIVTTGLRGTDGMIEITSGIKEGDMIAIIPKE